MHMRRWMFFVLALTVATGSLAREGDVQEREEAVPGLSCYKPIYALIGNQPIFESKMQLSFKYRFFDEEAFQGKWTKPLNQLFFAYTQKMFWDLEANSAPYPNNYLDSYFSPEFIYLNRNVAESFWGSQLDLQFGYQHESNGRDEADARNWERLYIQPTWVFGQTNGYQFIVASKVWAIVAKSAGNKDIEEYLGYGELQLKYGKDDGILVDLMLRKGTSGYNGAVELNASYPVKLLNIFLYGQAFYGYGDALRIYDEETASFRIGVAFSR
ncbi:MAG: phospholipase A [Verrucomicrobiota bacterium]